MSATRRLERMPAHNQERRDDGLLTPHSLRARMITLTLLAIGVLSVLLAVPGLREVLSEIGHLKAPWLILALGLEVASCLSFVVIFRHFFNVLPARLTRGVAWTEMGSGALLPGGGAGSLAIGGWLLHRAGMPTRDVVRRSSGLFFLTSATNVAALIGGGVLLLAGLSSSSHPLLLGGPPILLGLLGAGSAITLPHLIHHRTTWGRRWPWLNELIAGIGEAEHALLRPSWRQLGALGYLGFDIAVLWATLSAVGYHPQLATLLLGYILGYLANMIPIPGGIGVLEGGLVGALVLYGAPPTHAVAGVLIYHAIAFWIPSLGGLWAYGRIRNQIPPTRRPQSVHSPDPTRSSRTAAWRPATRGSGASGEPPPPAAAPAQGQVSLGTIRAGRDERSSPKASYIDLLQAEALAVAASR